jgi:hypothetical protein
MSGKIDESVYGLPDGFGNWRPLSLGILSWKTDPFPNSLSTVIDPL